MYIVYYCENLRDGKEEGVKIVTSLKEAKDVIEEFANDYGVSNTTFQIFELGKEIPLHLEEGEIQTVTTQTKFICEIK